MSEFEIQIRGDEYTGLEFFKSHDLKSHIAEIRRVATICAPDVWKISFELPMHGGVRELYRVIREDTKWIVTQLAIDEEQPVEKRICELEHLLGMCESINLLRG
jgi:predicted metal-dependent hydrolase